MSCFRYWASFKRKERDSLFFECFKAIFSKNGNAGKPHSFGKYDCEGYERGCFCRGEPKGWNKSWSSKKNYSGQEKHPSAKSYSPVRLHVTIQFLLPSLPKDAWSAQ